MKKDYQKINLVIRFYLHYLVSKNKKKCITSGKQFREEKFSIVLNSLHVIKNKKYLNFFKKVNKLLKLSGADAYNYCLLAEGKIDSIIDNKLIFQLNLKKVMKR